MANGLLDFFGKEYEDPRTQGLLQFGLGLMQQGGYQDRPVSLGQAFGAAGQQGMQAYQQAVAEKQRKEQLAAQKSMQDLQMKQMQQAMAAQQEQQELARKQREQTAAQRSLVMQSLGANLQDMALPRDRAGERSIDTQLATALAMGQDPTQALTYLAGKEQREREAKIQEQQLKRGELGLKTSDVNLKILEQNLANMGQTDFEFKVAGDKLFRLNPKTGASEVLYSSPATVEDPDQLGIALSPKGEFIGRAFKGSDGKTIIKDAMGNVIEGVEDFGLYSDAQYSKMLEDPTKLAELKLEIDTDIDAYRKLDELAKSQEGMPSGIDYVAAQVMGNMNTLIGNPKTAEQMRVHLLNGQKNALLGLLRLETVGGGVMTEQDALRVISVLGMDNIDAFFDPAKVAEAVKKVMITKVSLMRSKMNSYNSHIMKMDQMGGYTPYNITPYLSVEDALAIADEELGAV